MKRLYFFPFIFISLTFFSCAPQMETSQSERTIQRVIEAPGLNKKQIYDKALEWMAKTFVSANEVIQLKDSDNGKIIGRGITEFTNGTATIPCEYSITIETKDGKCRVTCDQFVGLWGVYHTDRSPLRYEDHVYAVRANLANLIDNLNAFLKNNKPDNW